MTTPQDWALLVFLKAPRPGRVKTRLAAGLHPDGPARAAAIYRRLAETTVAETRVLARAGVRVVLQVEPGDALAEVGAWLGDDPILAAQAPGDLGSRMATAMGDAFAAGAARVVIIGTDCPGLRATHAALAFRALDEADLVIGPARDGGYWLVGARDGVPPLFTGVPWSTPEVFAATRALASEAGLTVALLETLGDVDTVDDLALLQGDPRFSDVLR